MLVNSSEQDRCAMFMAEGNTAPYCKTIYQTKIHRRSERNSSNAQIRTLLEEQRQTIIAEYREKVSHHELHAAQAEEERRLLQGQLLQQKLEFREAHQRSLTEMEELRKFQSSAFDTMARRKLVEDQKYYFRIIRQSTGTAK